jgi:hypothetical protein
VDSIYLGNVNTQELESRLGIVLTEEERSFLRDSHQPQASNIAPDKWHCFDIPFTFACGSVDLAKKVHSILLQYQASMKGQLVIAVSGNRKEATPRG